MCNYFDPCSVPDVTISVLIITGVIFLIVLLMAPNGKYPFEMLEAPADRQGIQSRQPFKLSRNR